MRELLLHPYIIYTTRFQSFLINSQISVDIVKTISDFRFQYVLHPDPSPVRNTVIFNLSLNQRLPIPNTFFNAVLLHCFFHGASMLKQSTVAHF